MWFFRIIFGFVLDASHQFVLVVRTCLKLLSACDIFQNILFPFSATCAEQLELYEGTYVRMDKLVNCNFCRFM